MPFPECLRSSLITDATTAMLRHAGCRKGFHSARWPMAAVAASNVSPSPSAGIAAISAAVAPSSTSGCVGGSAGWRERSEVVGVLSRRLYNGGGSAIFALQLAAPEAHLMRSAIGDLSRFFFQIEAVDFLRRRCKFSVTTATSASIIKFDLLVE